MGSIDYGIIVLYFTIVIGLGWWYKKRASRNLEAYFLGDKNMHWLPLAIILMIPVTVQAQGAASACDPAIKQNPEHPQGYYERDAQLCEGVYETGVSSLGMTLVSFTGRVGSRALVIS